MDMLWGSHPQNITANVSTHAQSYFQGLAAAAREVEHPESTRACLMGLLVTRQNALSQFIGLLLAGHNVAHLDTHALSGRTH